MVLGVWSGGYGVFALGIVVSVPVDGGGVSP
jgi:hypothetical protein